MGFPPSMLACLLILPLLSLVSAVISELIIKGKLRLHQLAGIDPPEIIVPFTRGGIKKLWDDSEPRQRACANLLGEIYSNYPKSNRISLIKRTTWILLQIVMRHTNNRSPYILY